MDDIVRLHSLFSNELKTASWSFFVWKGINKVAVSDRIVHDVLNKNALSWVTISHSLQCTFFITLGRLFDIDGRVFSVHAFLRACMNNIDQFSREALKARKKSLCQNGAPSRLEEYVQAAYVPSKEDFQFLRDETSKKHKEYEEIYRPIRNKVIAHTEMQTVDNVHILFGKTTMEQVEGFLVFLHQIKMIVFDLLYNGNLSKIGDYKFDDEARVYADIERLLMTLKAQPPTDVEINR